MSIKLEYIANTWVDTKKLLPYFGQSEQAETTLDEETETRSHSREDSGIPNPVTNSPTFSERARVNDNC